MLSNSEHCWTMLSTIVQCWAMKLSLISYNAIEANRIKDHQCTMGDNNKWESKNWFLELPQAGALKLPITSLWVWCKRLLKNHLDWKWWVGSWVECRPCKVKDLFWFILFVYKVWFCSQWGKKTVYAVIEYPLKILWMIKSLDPFTLCFAHGTNTK